MGRLECRICGEIDELLQLADERLAATGRTLTRRSGSSTSGQPRPPFRPARAGQASAARARGASRSSCSTEGRRTSSGPSRSARGWSARRRPPAAQEAVARRGREDVVVVVPALPEHEQRDHPVVAGLVAGGSRAVRTCGGSVDGDRRVWYAKIRTRPPRRARRARGKRPPDRVAARNGTPRLIQPRRGTCGRSRAPARPGRGRGRTPCPVPAPASRASSRRARRRVASPRPTSVTVADVRRGRVTPSLSEGAVMLAVICHPLRDRALVVMQPGWRTSILRTTRCSKPRFVK